MRRESDLPRPRLRSRISGRVVLIVLGLLFLGVIVFGRAIASFYVDALWHDALGRSDVFWGQLWAKVSLFLIFFAVFAILAAVNLVIADRTAPTSFPANVHPYVERFHEVFGQRLRLVRYGTAMVLAFMLALPAVSRWQDWLLFRNSKSFGVDDAQFGFDVGFYVFELPFYTFVIDWLFAALVIVLLLTVAAHLLNGGVLFTSSVPTVRPATKMHIAVLLAVLGIGQGCGLLVHTVRADERTARLRAGRHVHRRQRPAPGDDAARVDRAAHCSAVPRHDPYRSVAAAARRVGPLAGGADRRRSGVPGDRAVVGRPSEPGGPGSAVHRAQRRGDACGDGHRRGDDRRPSASTG